MDLFPISSKPRLNMSTPKVKSTMENLLPNLQRLKATKPRIYGQKLELYRELMVGGDGGKLPDGGSFRDLHFTDWTARDFALLLAELGEEVEIPSAEDIPNEAAISGIADSAESKVGWLNKLFGSLKPNKE